jgi:hypothetical protein
LLGGVASAKRERADGQKAQSRHLHMAESPAFE